MNDFSQIQITANHKRNQGMYIGEINNPDCKECKQVLITTYPDPTSSYQYDTGLKYQRNTKNHKKGDIKYQTRYSKWICTYSNILKAWEAVSDYPTVSYGLTCNQRNVLIVDIDEYFASLKEAEMTLKAAKPTYIIRNPKTGHIQFGFVVKESIPKYMFDKFNKAIKELARVFKSDACYNGPACKNPYYYGFESIVYDDRIYDAGYVATLCKSYLKDKINTLKSQETHIYKHSQENSFSYSGNINVLSYCFLYNTNTNQNNTNQNNTNLNNTKVIGENSNTLGCSDVRVADGCTQSLPKLTQNDNHVRTYMKYLRNRIFSYFRETHGQQCSLEIARKYEQEVIQDMKAEGWIFNNMKQTTAATEKILKWCNTKGLARYAKPGTIKGNAVGHIGRAKSQKVRHEKMTSKIAVYRDWMSKNASLVDFESKGKPRKGLISRKKAAELIGITYDEFRAYRYMELKGEISYAREEESCRNSEKEARTGTIEYAETDVQGRVDTSSECSSRVEEETKREEQRDRRFERRTQDFTEEMQISIKVVA